VEWRVATSSLDENGFSVDIALMEDLLEKITSGIADRLLNDLEFFKERQASVENTALYLHQELSRALEEHGVDVDAFQEMEIKIWESDVAWASYRSR
jgi:6-pyruvoyl-tetrahydropterin synthase